MDSDKMNAAHPGGRIIFCASFHSAEVRDSDTGIPVSSHTRSVTQRLRTSTVMRAEICLVPTSYCVASTAHPSSVHDSTPQILNSTSDTSGSVRSDLQCSVYTSTVDGGIQKSCVSTPNTPTAAPYFSVVPSLAMMIYCPSGDQCAEYSSCPCRYPSVSHRLTRCRISPLALSATESSS